MVDLQETPAVPPMETGGDDRWGFQVAGGVLIALGWGIADLLNVALHRLAPAAGIRFGPLTIYSSYGLPSEVALAVGAFTGFIGLGIVAIAGSAPRGALVVPGYPYERETGPAP